ncbi:MAG: hypothetical protein H7281_13400 [Bacteriovorax sp.]|nr:hypothetical protein [Bacteriovorax sp.]
MSGDFANLAQLNFGEFLVAEVFRKIIGSIQIEDNKKAVCFYEKDVNGTLKLVNKELSSKFTDVHESTNSQLFINLDDEFHPMDGMHRIDVCLREDDSLIFPIEVKLGKTGGAEKFPTTFINFWNHQDDKLEIYGSTKKGVNLFRGNMILTLDSDKLIDCRKNSENINDQHFKKFIEFHSNEKPGFEISNKWGLVIRKNSVIGSDGKYPEPIPCLEFRNLQYVFIFEELWNCLTFIGQQDIISKIKQQITDEFERLTKT